MTASHTTLPDYRLINKNFLIRWRKSDEPNTSWDKLIGAGRFAEKFGEDYKVKYFSKAFYGSEDRYEFRIRGKYIITFISR